MTSKTNAAASGTVSRLSARYDALGLSVLRTELSSGDGMEMIGEETDDNPLAPQAGLLQDASGSHGPMSTPLESPLQSPLLASTPLTERELLSEGSKRLEFKYDYIGRRVSKQVWTHTGGSWTDESTTAFVYDGWNLIEEVSTSSQTASINHYTWGLDLSLSLQGAGGVGGLLALSGVEGLDLSYVSGPAPSTFHYTYDLNGNVSEVLDESGSIAAHYEYGPFGEMLVESYSAGLGTAVASFRFSTKYYDAELKTYYYGYRYYDPTTGRWLNRDPIEESGGLNLYGFVGNMPSSYTDYLGLEFVDLGVREVAHASMPRDGSRWWGSTGLVSDIGWFSSSLPEIGVDEVEEYEDSTPTTNTDGVIECKRYCARITQAKSYKVKIVSWVANDKLNVAYTADGYAAIKAHEERRRDVYALAYAAYIEKINDDWKESCNPLCSSKPEEAKKELLKWIEKMRKRAHSAFKKYVTGQQSKITREGIESNVNYDSKGLMIGLISIHNPEPPKPLILPKCPTCK